MDEKNEAKFNKIIIAVSAIIIFIIMVFVTIFIIMYINDEKNKLNDTGNQVNNIDRKVAEKIVEKVDDTPIVDDFNQTFSRAVGKIEVTWVDSNNNNITLPLKPELNGLKPIKYNIKTSKFESVDEKDPSWYDYEKKEWANALDGNNSYFVWIPRFAYKITYYQDNSCNKVIGYLDYRGLIKVNEDGSLTRIASNNQGLRRIGNNYILHPAFMNDVTNGFTNGGWDDNLKGIWVSKYEVSMEVDSLPVNTLDVQTGNVITSDRIKAVSKPGVSSWRNISIGKCYYNSYNYNRQRDSHLMKNSEWGAVAYLSYSKFGLDSGLIEINDSLDFMTGNAKNASDSFIYKAKESSTGNATGVYDLVGGAWEYVSAYINNGYARAPEYAGTEPGYLMEDNKNSKYKTIYSNIDEPKENSNYNTDVAVKNYNLNSSRRGDAIYETSINGYGSASWNTNASLFMQKDVAFTIRGGDASSGISAGLFCYNASTGQPNMSDSYRIVLV